MLCCKYDIMAKYNITSLNYINVGSKRAFFNIDSKLDYSLSVDYRYLSTESGTEESKSGFITTEDEVSVRLFKEEDTEESIEKIRIFTESQTRNGVVLLGEYGDESTQIKNVVNNDETNFLPLYDIADVKIKSLDDVNYKNNRINAEDTYVNVFLPQMKSQPLGFCQYSSGQLVDTVMLTEPMTQEPLMFSSSLKDKTIDTQEQYYFMQLKNTPTHTYLYKTPEDWGCPLSDVISSDEMALEVFEPHRDLLGLPRAYILDFPDSEVQSEYDTGNVHAEFLQAKNTIDSKYSMNMSSNVDLNGVREYCGINKTANKIYLKFYDGANYSGVGQRVNANGIIESNASKTTQTYPYQKIEIISKNKFTNKQNHKSNLFSINIDDLVDLSENRDMASITGDDETNSIMSQIRDDICSAVKDIVNNVTPANTQLFKVYFGL